MRKAYCTIILCFFIHASFAQNVASINGKPITNKEFMWFYKKNHQRNSTSSAKDLESYLNQYINFKLKVLDARDMGLDADTAYIAEIKNYESAMGAQKRTSKNNQTHAMMMNEYRDAALMFNVSEIKVWNKAVEQQEQIEKDWIDTLRKKYNVKINQNELRKLSKL